MGAKGEGSDLVALLEKVRGPSSLSSSCYIAYDSFALTFLPPPAAEVPVQPLSHRLEPFSLSTTRAHPLLTCIKRWRSLSHHACPLAAAARGWHRACAAAPRRHHSLPCDFVGVPRTVLVSRTVRLRGTHDACRSCRRSPFLLVDMERTSMRSPRALLADPSTPSLPVACSFSRTAPMSASTRCIGTWSPG